MFRTLRLKFYKWNLLRHIGNAQINAAMIQAECRKVKDIYFWSEIVSKLMDLQYPIYKKSVKEK